MSEPSLRRFARGATAALSPGWGSGFGVSGEASPTRRIIASSAGRYPACLEEGMRVARRSLGQAVANNDLQPLQSLVPGLWSGHSRIHLLTIVRRCRRRSLTHDAAVLTLRDTLLRCRPFIGRGRWEVGFRLQHCARRVRG
jgi:hypothetical protein